jgi:hypothetical protein
VAIFIWTLANPSKCLTLSLERAPIGKPSVLEVSFSRWGMNLMRSAISKCFNCKVVMYPPILTVGGLCPQIPTPSTQLGGVLTGASLHQAKESKKVKMPKKSHSCHHLNQTPFDNLRKHTSRLVEQFCMVALQQVRISWLRMYKVAISLFEAR